MNYRYIHGNNIIYNGAQTIRFYLVIILINLIAVVIITMVRSYLKFCDYFFVGWMQPCEKLQDWLSEPGRSQ